MSIAQYDCVAHVYAAVFRYPLNPSRLDDVSKACTPFIFKATLDIYQSQLFFKFKLNQWRPKRRQQHRDHRRH
jgi:hypothetical protein